MTPLRKLTDAERDILARLRVEAAHPVQLDHLLAELIVARDVLRRIRQHRRCLPQGGQRALDEMPHHHRTAVDFSNDRS